MLLKSLQPGESGGVADLGSLVADALPDGLTLVDHRGLICLMNNTAEVINGLDRRTCIGRPLSRWVRDSVAGCNALVDAFESGASVNQIHTSAKGQEFLVSTHFISGGPGDGPLFAIIQRSLDTHEERVHLGRRADRYMSLGRPEPDEDAPDLILSKRTREIIEHGVRAMRLGSRILLTGESGVGKTAIAKAIHNRVAGSARPFVHVNCGSIPESLFESELFGYERGAFTGALQRGKKGLVEAANGGTLFLDEIGETPLAAQAKLLKFLEDGAVQRLGAVDTKAVSTRIVAATNRDLFDMIQHGGFRKDLFFRISTLSLEVPPLRESREVVPQLLQRFTALFARKRRQPLELSEACRQHLMAYAYPGNVRELQNIIEHLAIVSDERAEVSHLPHWVLTAGNRTDDGPPREAATQPTTLREAVREFESSLIEQAIRAHGSKRKAAEVLGVDIATVVRKSRN